MSRQVDEATTQHGPDCVHGGFNNNQSVRNVNNKASPTPNTWKSITSYRSQSHHTDDLMLRTYERCVGGIMR